VLRLKIYEVPRHD